MKTNRAYFKGYLENATIRIDGSKHAKAHSCLRITPALNVQIGICTIANSKPRSVILLSNPSGFSQSTYRASNGIDVINLIRGSV